MARKDDFQFWSIKILVITVIIFVLQMAFPITDLLALYPPALAYQPWTLITAMFVHANIGHIFQNMLALAIFGIVLEKIIGSKRFLYIYLLSGFIANIAGYFAYADVTSLGASGAIMGVVGVLTVLRPRLMVWFGGPMPLIVLAGLWAFTDLVGFFAPGASTIGHAAHLAGLAIGVAYGFKWRKKFAEERLVVRRVKEFLSDSDVYG